MHIGRKERAEHATRIHARVLNPLPWTDTAILKRLRDNAEALVVEANLASGRVQQIDGAWLQDFSELVCDGITKCLNPAEQELREV